MGEKSKEKWTSATFTFVNFPLSDIFLWRLLSQEDLIFSPKIQDIVSGSVEITLNQQGFKNQIDSFLKWVKIKMSYQREAELGHVNKMEKAWTTWWSLAVSSSQTHPAEIMNLTITLLILKIW